MDVFIVRELRVSGNEDMAMGWISSDNIHVLNEDVVRSFQTPNG
jgi:predicted phosphoribosyltransferase